MNDSRRTRVTKPIMPRILLLVCLSLLVASVRADELTKSVQSVLKEQGFFYGEATGASGPETAAAVKRFQIRNGLEVTGTFTKETLDALGLGGEPAAPAPVEPAPKAAAPIERQPEPPPPVNLRKDNSVQEKDRDFLRRETPPATARVPAEPPMRRAPTPSGPYGHVFAQTPYASAPIEVQQDTIKRAQRFLRELSFYRESIDGQPGPALEEAILGYQRFIALPLTGQLDLETLAAMRLLPGRGGAPAQSANPKVRTVPGQPLKGVWIK